MSRSLTFSRWAAAPLAVALLAGFGAQTAGAAPNIPPGPQQLAQPGTPPPPGPDGLADAPPVASGHWLTEVQALTDDKKMTIGFRASMPNVTMQFATSAPKLIDGRWSMGAAQPVSLKGTNLNPGAIVTPGGKGNYEFTKTIEGLTPGTKYHVLVTAPVGQGYLPVQKVASFASELLVNEGTTRGDVWAEHVFFSSRSAVQFSIGRTHEQAMAKSFTTVHGTKVSSPGQADRYRFTRLIENLTPNTKYHTVLRVPKSGNRLGDLQAGNFITKKRHVMATVESIKVIDDADKGLRGAGDLRFYLRAQKDNDPQAKLQWSKGSDDVKMSSGETSNRLGRNLFVGMEPTSDTLHLFVQGVEDDTLPTTRKACHLNEFFGHKNAARQDSKSMCHDASFAWGVALLPTTKYSGKHEQVITARVGKSPALRFEAKIRVVTSTH